MPRIPDPDQLGSPDLRVAGFQLWIHSREFPHDQDYWLNVSAHCGAAGASVWATGAIVTVFDLAEFGKACDAMYGGTADEALLEPVEPNLSIRIKRTEGAGILRQGSR
jgi:hypothetical protein